MANILIIDDDKSLCGAVVRKLAKLEHAADDVHTLADAYEMAAAGDYDIILLDVRMPDGNGLEQLPRLKSVASAPEVIIITGGGNPDGAELAIKSGAWCYLEKATIIKDLALPITRALEYRQVKKKSATVGLMRNDLVGSSSPIAKCLEHVSKIASTDANVLITGETGTGKEVFARTVHGNSPRAKGNFVVVDCASLPENLVETTLFGHEKGAFTDAVRAHTGLIKQADGGTLFLDEIGELPVSMQKSFLRVLEEKSFRPVGSANVVHSNFRLISATHRDLHAMVAQGLFRNDLLFRIESCTIDIPPLRERLEDIRELTDYCINKLCERYGQEFKSYSVEFLEVLTKYDWPGNVRELFHVLDHAFAEGVLSPTLFSLYLPEKIRILHARMNVKGKGDAAAGSGRLPSDLPPSLQWRQARENFEKKFFHDLMMYADGNIQTASMVSGLSRTRLYQLVEKYKAAEAK
ncbi:MAG: sigma-54 dependent transcriptional regulator [Desulfobulbaceae bacterium]|nr:sigma-54 dependent transcriptional regulator [Desulfobulbaceae bacterium]